MNAFKPAMLLLGIISFVLVASIISPDAHAFTFGRSMFDSGSGISGSITSPGFSASLSSGGFFASSNRPVFGSYFGFARGGTSSGGNGRIDNRFFSATFGRQRFVLGTFGNWG